MKRVIALMLSIAMIASLATGLAITGFATDGFNSSVFGGKVTIKGYNGNVPSNLEIPDTIDGYPVTSIETSAFLEKNSVMNVTIPSDVISIGANAFYYCTNLTSVIVKATNPPTLGVSALDGCSSLAKIYVPARTADAYKTAQGWSAYAKKIIGVSGITINNTPIEDCIDSYNGTITSRTDDTVTVDKITSTNNITINIPEGRELVVSVTDDSTNDAIIAGSKGGDDLTITGSGKLIVKIAGNGSKDGLKAKNINIANCEVDINVSAETAIGINAPSTGINISNSKVTVTTNGTCISSGYITITDRSIVTATSVKTSGSTSGIFGSLSIAISSDSIVNACGDKAISSASLDNIKLDGKKITFSDIQNGYIKSNEINVAYKGANNGFVTIPTQTTPTEISGIKINNAAIETTIATYDNSAGKFIIIDGDEVTVNRIYLNSGDLEIEIPATKTLVVSTTDNNDAICAGSGSITITGGGKLIAKAAGNFGNAIYAENGNVEIENCEVEAIQPGESGPGKKAIHGKIITFTNSTVIADGAWAGISADTSLNISDNSAVKARGKGIAIYNANIEIYFGNEKITESDMLNGQIITSGIKGIKVLDNDVNDGFVSIPVPEISSGILINNVTITNKNYADFGITLIDNKFDYEDGTLTIASITTSTDMTINIPEGKTLIVSNTNGNAIEIKEGGNLTITGSGTLIATGNKNSSSGIYLKNSGKIIISGTNTTIEANGEKYGIYSDGGNIEITGAIVKAKAIANEAYSSGIYSESGSIIISGTGTTVEAEANGNYSSGIYVGGDLITLTDGNIVQAKGSSKAFAANTKIIVNGVIITDDNRADYFVNSDNGFVKCIIPELVETGISINNTTITNFNYKSLSITGFNYDSATKTLTVSKIEKTTDTIIHIPANNTLKVSGTDGINITGTLTITGEGTLDVDVTKGVKMDTVSAIQATDAINISNCKINVSATNTEFFGSSTGIKCDSDIIISSGEIKIEAKTTRYWSGVSQDFAIDSASIIINNNPIVSAKGKTAAYKVSQNIVINGVTIDNNNYNDYFISATNFNGTQITGDDFVTVNYPPASAPIETGILINNTTITNQNYGNYGITGFNYDSATNTLTVERISKTDNNVTINIQEGETLIVSTTNNKAICVESGNLTLTGGGELVANGSKTGISAENGIKIENLKVTATSIENNSVAIYSESGKIEINNSTVTAYASGTDSYGIFAKSDIIISGTDTVVTATATENDAICSETGNVVINDGAVTANGRSNGIYAGNAIKISGGNIIAEGTNYGITAAGGDLNLWTDANIKAKGSMAAFSASFDICVGDTKLNQLTLTDYFYGMNEQQISSDGQNITSTDWVVFGTAPDPGPGPGPNPGPNPGPGKDPQPAEEEEQSDPEVDIDFGFGSVSVKTSNKSIVLDDRRIVEKIIGETEEDFISFDLAHAYIANTKSTKDFDGLFLNNEAYRYLGEAGKDIEIVNRFAKAEIYTGKEVGNNPLSLHLSDVSKESGLCATAIQKKAMNTDKIYAEVNYSFVTNGKPTDNDAKIYVPVDGAAKVFYLFNAEKIGIVPCEVKDGYCIFNRYFDGTYIICAE